MAEIIPFPRQVPDSEFERLVGDPELIADLVDSYREGRKAVRAMLAAITNDLDLSKRSPMFVAAVKSLRAWDDK